MQSTPSLYELGRQGALRMLVLARCADLDIPTPEAITLADHALVDPDRVREALKIPLPNVWAYSA